MDEIGMSFGGGLRKSDPAQFVLPAGSAMTARFDRRVRIARRSQLMATLCRLPGHPQQSLLLPGVLSDPLGDTVAGPGGRHELHVSDSYKRQPRIIPSRPPHTIPPQHIKPGARNSWLPQNACCSGSLGETHLANPKSASTQCPSSLSNTFSE